MKNIRLIQKELLDSSDIVLSEIKSKSGNIDNITGFTKDRIRSSLGEFVRFLPMTSPSSNEELKKRCMDTVELSLGDVLDMNTQEFLKFSKGENIEGNAVKEISHEFRKKMFEIIEKMGIC